MAKYKIYYSGFAFVEADSEEEAKEVYWDEYDIVYEDRHLDEIEEIDEFAINF